jgi:hypothetical protein
MPRLLLALALLGLPLCAEPLKVDDPVAEFAPNNWLNPPAYDTFASLKGDVIVFFAWNKDTDTAVKALPALNKLAAKPGMHVVSLYTGVHKFSDLEAVLAKQKVEFPIALDSFWPAGYDAPKVPKAWVIGADGKVKFIGETGFEKAAEDELAKVKYPGLGKDSLAKGVEAAAKLYAEGKYGQALAAAQKVADSSEDKAEQGDADWLVKHIEAGLKALITRADTCENDRDYSRAKRCWQEVAKYTPMENAAQATERLKKLDENAAVAKEITARRDLLALNYDKATEKRKIDKADTKKLRKFYEAGLAAYKKFAEDNKGTVAGDRAAEQVGWYEESIKELDDAEKK